MKACGLSRLPLLSCRHTFDRRLKTISIDIKERITTMGHLFVLESLANPYILAIDSTLIKANKGKIWHKSSMDKGIVPRLGITKMQDGDIVIQRFGYWDINYL